jgi:cytochrome c oxidase subunit 2
MTGPHFSALDPQGPQADHIHSLWNVFLGVCTAVWAAVTLVLLVAAVRAWRQRMTKSDPLAIDHAQNARLLRVIGAAVGATVLTLIALLVASITAGNALAKLDDDPHAIHARVVAHQWWWEIEYLPDDPELAATTANELHVPVGRTVTLELTSRDVIHSFWVPSIHGKKDLIPGRMNQISIRVDHPGELRGQCAEFCGLEHALMQLRVVAEPEADFAAYLAHLRTAGTSPSDDQTKRGQQIFLSRPCASCHTIAGTPAGGKLGPDLTHVASRLGIAASLPPTRGHLAGWVVDPQAVKPGVRMPRNLMSGDDLSALLAYLESLK